MTLLDLLITARCHIAVCYTRGRAMLMGLPIGQPTWDPFETDGPKPYLALLGRNVDNIRGKCGQKPGPICVTHIPHGTHMKQVDKDRMGSIWVAHMGLI